MLTACGIETVLDFDDEGFAPGVATVLTACGIETGKLAVKVSIDELCVATVLTACGIETRNRFMVDNADMVCCNSAYRLRY